MTRAIFQPGRAIRVLVVDDSVVVRSLLIRCIEEDAELELAGFAANGAIALARIPQVQPDVVILDIEMPEMDGLQTLRLIRRQYPRIRVVMFSSMTERGAAITLEALALGADDYATKFSNEAGAVRSIVRLREELVPKIKQFFIPAEAPKQESDAAPRLGSGGGAPRRPAPAPMAVAIGVSTGGPAALEQVLAVLPGDFPLPVLVVQHMPPVFTRMLADRLRACCRLAVREAAAGELVTPGNILIAPGGCHMKTTAAPDGVRILLDESAPLNSCRPSVDALFLSMADVYGGAVITVVLTGMGQDGLRGAMALKRLGGFVVAQDKLSSVVWGMPAAVVHAGLADAVVPLRDIAAAIVHRATKHPLPAEAAWRS